MTDLEDQAEWEARQDMATLEQAEKIKNNPDRVNRAVNAAETERERLGGFIEEHKVKTTARFNNETQNSGMKPK